MLDAQLLEDYTRSLRYLTMLAQRDMINWWKKTEHLSYAAQVSKLQDPFEAIVQVYGEQAAYAAADYMFLQRSLGDALSGLEYPELADPIDFDQARSSYRWAMHTARRHEGVVDRVSAQNKLSGVLSRLVLAPARETVVKGTLVADTKFARVPEPGACAWCLMLAANGAFYTREAVVDPKTGKDRRGYHDNCRCVGIEVRTPDDLPRINQELHEAWQGQKRRNGGKLSDKQWEVYIKSRRALAQENVKFPPIPGITTPKYRGRGTRFVNGVEEELPNLDQLAGHVLYGWRSRDNVEYGEVQEHYSTAPRRGHSPKSKEVGKTRWPEGWTDQQIVDAVRDVLEDPTLETKIGRYGNRIVEGEVNGVWIRASYEVHLGQPAKPYAYPMKVRGTGVTEIQEDGTVLEW